MPVFNLKGLLLLVFVLPMLALVLIYQLVPQRPTGHGWSEGKANVSSIMAPMKVEVATHNGMIPPGYDQSLNVDWKFLTLTEDDYNGTNFKASDYRVVILSKPGEPARWQVMVTATNGRLTGVYILNTDGTVDPKSTAP
ncbi:MAG: hypothetical protein AB7K09_09785 [Planctomycetota bacterium]